MTGQRRNGEEQIDLLLAAYREACQVPEASADFMPGLWEKVESRRSWTSQVWHWANGFAAAAALASVLFVALQLMPENRGVFAQATYIDALAEQEGEQAVLQAVAVVDVHQGPQAP